MAKINDGVVMNIKLHSEGNRVKMKTESEKKELKTNVFKIRFRRILRDVKYEVKNDFIIFEKYGDKFYFNKKSSFILESIVHTPSEHFHINEKDGGSIGFKLKANGMDHTIASFKIPFEHKDKAYNIKKTLKPIFVEWFENILFGEEGLGITSN